MSKILGYFVAIILIGLGVGGLFYLSHPKDYSDSVLEDISPETGYNWGNIEEGMYVKLDANNQAAYYSYKKDENGNDLKRLYLVFNYNQKTKKYNHLIGVLVDSEEFDKWEMLEKDNLSSTNILKKITVKDHVHKIPSTVLKSVKGSLVIERDDISDIDDMLIPYYIGPAVMSEDIAIYKIVSWIAIGVGGIILLVSVIGAIFVKE